MPLLREFHSQDPLSVVTLFYNLSCSASFFQRFLLSMESPLPGQAIRHHVPPFYVVCTGGSNHLHSTHADPRWPDL